MLVAVVGAIGLAAVTAPAPAGAAGAAGAAGTISMSGSSTALPVVADLAYFYQHTHRHAPRFSLVGGGSSAGIIDAAPASSMRAWPAASGRRPIHPGSCSPTSP